MAQAKAKAALLLEQRCLCGCLLAKVSLDGVEILCRRCKRTHLIPWPGERREGGSGHKARLTLSR